MCVLCSLKGTPAPPGRSECAPWGDCEKKGDVLGWVLYTHKASAGATRDNQEIQGHLRVCEEAVQSTETTLAARTASEEGRSALGVGGEQRELCLTKSTGELMVVPRSVKGLIKARHRSLLLPAETQRPLNGD